MISDVYRLICYRQARYQDAYILNKETSYLREKLDLPRITYIERLVEDKRNKLLAIIPTQLQDTPINVTLYDLIDKLWAYLYAQHTS